MTATPSRRLAGFAALVVAVAAVVSAAVPGANTNAVDPPAGTSKETLVGGKPLFDSWPKNQKPDAVIFFSGQTYGFVQPCGCSRPQMGGLERRAYFVNTLKAKGWPVAGVDLGDLYPEKAAVEDQSWLKYVATMNALRDMGYLAVGVGKTEISADLMKLIAQYALQKEQRPFTLAANVVGVNGKQLIPRDQHFPPPGAGKRPMVEAVEVGEVGKVVVGVAGVVGKALAEENKTAKWDDRIDFPNAKQGITDARDALKKHAAKPAVRVLIFQGPLADAKLVAADFPEFQVILCRAEEGAPAPLQPTVPEKSDTRIIQVGEKGQNIGVLGLFKKPDGSFEFHYQLVPLGEEFVQPGKDEDAVKANRSLLALDWYAGEVKRENFLPKYPKRPHVAQIQALALKPAVKLTYVGSESCKTCHKAEYEKWEKTPHGHAMDTLEKVAKRPALRQFDGECVQCHSVGFHHPSGYTDATKTPYLKHVGCESCHGPGSGHSAAPRDKELLALMSPWKQEGAAKLPDAAFFKKMADTPAIERGKIAQVPAQQILVRQVEGVCMKCHDHEADPNFDIYKNWPKIDHTVPAPKGGGPEKAPK